MLTDKELIEAQEQDIKNLTIKLNTLWSEITVLRNKPDEEKISGYRFGVPYFRIDKYSIYCYKLTNVVMSKWNKKCLVNIDARFYQLFYITLSDTPQYTRTPGGTRKLSTCISLNSLVTKLNKRKDKAFKNGDSKTEDMYEQVLNLLKTHLSEFPEDFYLGGN